MWRSLEEEAIEIGLDLNYFWSINPNQYRKHLSIYNKKQEEQLKEKDTLNWTMGKYMIYAFNDPKKYPKKPFSLEEKKETKQTDREMEQQAMIITAQLGGIIHENNS